MCVYSKIAVLGGFSLADIVWRPISKVTVQQRRWQPSQGGPQSAQLRYIFSHWGLLMQHYQPQKVITSWNLHIINFKRVAGRSLHWLSRLPTSSTPLLIVYLLFTIWVSLGQLNTARQSLISSLLMNAINNYSKHYNQYHTLLPSQRTWGLWPEVLLEMKSLMGCKSAEVKLAAVGWGTTEQLCFSVGLGGHHAADGFMV